MTDTKIIMDKLKQTIPGNYIDDTVADVLMAIFDESRIPELYKAEVIFAMVRSYVFGFVTCENLDILSTK